MLLYNSAVLRNKTIDAVCFSKRMEWAYEQEWRVVTWRPNESDAPHSDYPFFPDELASITFGLRMSDEEFAHIKALIKISYPHATLYRIVSNYGDLSRVVA